MSRAALYAFGVSPNSPADVRGRLALVLSPQVIVVPYTLRLGQACLQTRYKTKKAVNSTFLALE